MTSCESMSDRMPAVAHGGEWTAGEADHLTTCPECAAEWRLIRASAAIAAGIGFDADRVSERVRARLATDPPAATPVVSIRSRRRVGWLVGIAAAAALAVFAVRAARSPAEVVAPDTAMLTELDGLDVAELGEVLEDWKVVSWKPSESVSGLGDLTAEELEQVLSGWETRS
jgi:hypothetical protein